MANISNVDYEGIPGQASQMRTYGQELNAEVTAAYKSVDDMRSSWYGKRYNSLIKEFNGITDQINELLTLVVTDIPYSLETIANNYSQADCGSNVANAQQTAPNKVSNIAESTNVGLKFVTSEVETVQTNVSTNFDNAKSKMTTIETAYNAIEWESEASEAFRTKFVKLKADIEAAFENIKTQFGNLMTQAQDDIQSAETSNTVQ